MKSEAPLPRQYGTPPFSGPARHWRAVRGPVTAVAVAAAMVHPLARAFARYSWAADLLTHFQDLGLVATVAAAALSVPRRRRLAAALCLLAVFQATEVFRYSGRNPVPTDPGSPERLRVIVMNLLVDNAMYADAVHLIETERPDVLGLIEYTPAWYFALAHLHGEYPYRIDAVGGADGLALWFREPPRRLDPPERLTTDGWPVLHATFEFAGRPRDLWLVHPRSPLKPERRSKGFPELQAVADRVASTPGSRIVIGDFNTSEGSPYFGDFVRTTGLRDTRYGFGRQQSWPTMQPYRIAIDHALVSEDLAVADRRLGHMIGSDHYPVVIDLAPARSEARSSRVDAGQSTSSP